MKKFKSPQQVTDYIEQVRRRYEAMQAAVGVMKTSNERMGALLTRCLRENRPPTIEECKAAVK